MIVGKQIITLPKPSINNLRQFALGPKVASLDKSLLSTHTIDGRTGWSYTFLLIL